MKEFIVTRAEAGLSMIKYSHKLLPLSPGSLLHKFIRNKNIELNGRKARPETPLKEGDRIGVFLSEDTFDKFSGKASDNSSEDLSGRVSARSGSGSAKAIRFKELIIYEDEDILILNKPSGLLSQGDKKGEASLNDLLLDYLGYDPDRDLVKPSVCNRLDKNTSGLVLAGKTAEGLKSLNGILKDRSLKKLYRAVVFGKANVDGVYEAYIYKDRSDNISYVSQRPINDSVPIKTLLRSVEHITDWEREIELTLLEAELITGRSHQIRAHLSYLGFPILGDRKYADRFSAEASRRLHISRQLLHSYTVTFPSLSGRLSYLSGRSFIADMPEDFPGFGG